MTHTQKRQQGFFTLGIALALAAIFATTTVVAKTSIEHEQESATNNSSYDVAEAAKK